MKTYSIRKLNWPRGWETISAPMLAEALAIHPAPQVGWYVVAQEDGSLRNFADEFCIVNELGMRCGEWDGQRWVLDAKEIWR